MAQKIDLAPVLQATQPQEAIDYFRQKGYRVGFDHQDVWRQEHQAAFTVAKALQIDLLQDIRGAVDAALTDGTTLADFKNRLTPQLQARGWWGTQALTDPLTGETVNARLGSPRRLQVIFDTNLATAYSEGQAERIAATQGLFEFLLYDGLNSERPREAHRPFDGLVLRADDPWWNSHRPVKAWGCKCTVVQLTRRMMEREGLAEGKAPAEQLRRVVNKRTGEEIWVAQGVDPAFAYPHGGRRANLAQLMMDKADAAHALTTARVLQGGAEQWAPLVDQGFAEFVGRYRAGERASIGQRRVAGVLAPRVLEQLGDQVPPAATVVARLQDLPALVDKASPAQADLLPVLPELLRNVGQAWWNPQTRRLVLLCTAPDELTRVARVQLRLGQPGTADQVDTALQAIDLVEPARFNPAGLVPLDMGQ